MMAKKIKRATPVGNKVKSPNHKITKTFVAFWPFTKKPGLS